MKIKLYVPKFDNDGKNLYFEILKLNNLILKDSEGFTRTNGEGFWRCNNNVYRDDIYIYTIVSKKIKLLELLNFIKNDMKQISVAYEINGNFKLYNGDDI